MDSVVSLQFLCAPLLQILCVSTTAQKQLEAASLFFAYFSKDLMLIKC